MYGIAGTLGNRFLTAIGSWTLAVGYRLIGTIGLP